MRLARDASDRRQWASRGTGGTGGGGGGGDDDDGQSAPRSSQSGPIEVSTGKQIKTRDRRPGRRAGHHLGAPVPLAALLLHWLLIHLAVVSSVRVASRRELSADRPRELTLTSPFRLETKLAREVGREEGRLARAGRRAAAGRWWSPGRAFIIPEAQEDEGEPLKQVHGARGRTRARVRLRLLRAVAVSQLAAAAAAQQEAERDNERVAGSGGGGTQEPPNGAGPAASADLEPQEGNQFDGEHSAASSLPGPGGGEEEEDTGAAADNEADEADDDRQQDGQPSSGVAGVAGANSSSAANETHCETLEDIEATRPPRTFGMVLAVNYGIIFVLGLLGNVLTLYVLWCKGKKRTAQDVLIVNLACSDILLCVFCVPIMPKYLIIDGYWTLGLSLCKIVSFAQSTSVYMSTYSLIYIGFIRYKLIVHPLDNNAQSKRRAFIYCLVTWSISFVYTLPYTLKVRLSPERCAIMFCDEAWDQPAWRFFFSLFTTVFQFLIPLSIVGFFNRKIYSSLDWRRTHELETAHGQAHHAQHPATSSQPQARPQQQQQQQQQLHQAPPANVGAASGKLKTGAAATAAAAAAAVAAAAATNATAASAAAAKHNQQQQQMAHNGSSNKHNGHHQHQHQQHQQQQQPTGDVLAIKEHRQRERAKRMRKANNRLIFVVIVFAHSWLPLNLFNMIQDYFEELGHWKYLTTTFLVVHQIACSSVIWNPILYAWMSETYRAELRAVLPSWLVLKLAGWLAEADRPPAIGVHGPPSTSALSMHLIANNNNNNNNKSNSNNKHNKNTGIKSGPNCSESGRTKLGANSSGGSGSGSQSSSGGSANTELNGAANSAPTQSANSRALAQPADAARDEQVVNCEPQREADAAGP